MYTPRLDPSLIGLITIGKLNFFFKFTLSPFCNKKYLGTFRLFFLKIILDSSLSIAKLEARTPE